MLQTFYGDGDTGANSTLVAFTASTLAGVTGRGASTSTACTFSSNTTFGGNVALSSGKFLTWNSGGLISTSIGLNSIQFNASNGTDSSTSYFSSDVDGSLLMEVENNGESFLLDRDGNSRDRWPKFITCL